MSESAGQRLREALPALAVRRPVTVLMAFLACLVMGTLAFLDIPLRMMPSGFDPPYLWVWVPYTDSTPTETDAQIVGPVTEQLATVPGLKSLGSRANTCSASFGLEFHQSVDMDEAYNSVADRMERSLAELPDDVRSYGIWRFDPSDEPVIWAGAAIDPSVENAHALMTEVVVRKLERVPGVARVETFGTDPKYVFVDFDRDAVFAAGLDFYSLMQALGSDNFQMASGRLRDRGELRYVRSLARYTDIEELRQTPVAPGVVLDDVATVHYRAEPGSAIWHIDGKPSAGLSITKESTANTVETCELVRQALDELDEDPRLEGFDFDVFFDQGALIEDSIDTLLNTALEGGLFAAIILFLFLREARMTLLIAASIPMSLIMTVSVLYFTGGSLNLLSLMGLMIAVGMVVDNAIVVVETIYHRRQEGMDATQSAIEGTGEVNLAITMSTLTTMVVFLPIILMSGNAMFSFFLGALGFPVVFALGASLVVALIFTPLSTIFLRGVTVRPDPAWIRWLSGLYGRWLRRLLTHRFDTALGGLFMLVLTIAVPFRQVGCTDEASGNLNDFQLDFELAPHFSYAERLARLEAMEAVLAEHKEEWGVRVTRGRVGSSGGRGTIWVYLQDEVEEERREEVREEVLAAMPDDAGVRVTGGRGGSTGRGSNLVTVQVEGEDPETLVELADEVVRRMRSVEQVIDAQRELDEDASEEIRLTVDRDAVARHGVSTTAIGRTLAFGMRGSRLPDFHDGEEEVETWARFQYADRQNLDTLLDFPLFSPITGSAVPLRSLTDAEVTRGFGTIFRNERMTSVRVTVELDKDITLDSGMALVSGAMVGMDFPQGYGWQSGDRWEQQMENDRARNFALLLSVAFVFIIMGILFESFLLPMAIVTTIPMAVLGVYWTLYLTDTPLDLMGGVGLIILIGVVVNNGIVLIDLVTQLRHTGLDRDEALIQAGERRMRPILMTALTTIFGLLPMALGSSSFIGIPYAPLARVVAGGIAAATLLTLFFVPYLYSCLDDLRGLGSRVIGYAWRSA